MTYRIYPSIGVARLGNHLSQFFIGPETPGHPGFDVDAQGNETPIAHYKVGEDQIKGRRHDFGCSIFLPTVALRARLNCRPARRWNGPFTSLTRKPPSIVHPARLSVRSARNSLPIRRRF